MNGFFSWGQAWAVYFGVPSVLVPVVPFLLLMAGIYGVIALAVLWARLRRPGSDKTVAFWLMVSPWLIGFVLFTAGPMIYSAYISFTSWNLLSAPKRIGFSNYQEALADPRVAQALKVTLVYALVSVPFQIILAFLVALILNAPLPGITWFRTIWFLPSLVSGVAQMVLFLWVFNPDYGLANTLLSKVGIQGPAWFNSATWALPTVILMSFWTVGGGMVIYLAGLKDVSPSLYEACFLDGGGEFRKFWHITLPQLSPLIFFNALTGIVGALQIFTQGYVATAAGGGPKDSLLFFVYYLYESAFRDFRMGYASALAWILFFIILALTALTFRASSFAVYYETEQKQKK